MNNKFEEKVKLSSISQRQFETLDFMKNKEDDKRRLTEESSNKNKRAYSSKLFKNPLSPNSNSILNENILKKIVEEKDKEIEKLKKELNKLKAQSEGTKYLLTEETQTSNENYNIRVNYSIKVSSISKAKSSNKINRNYNITPTKIITKTNSRMFANLNEAKIKSKVLNKQNLSISTTRGKNTLNFFEKKSGKIILTDRANINFDSFNTNRNKVHRNIQSTYYTHRNIKQNSESKEEKKNKRGFSGFLNRNRNYTTINLTDSVSNEKIKNKFDNTKKKFTELRTKVKNLFEKFYEYKTKTNLEINDKI